MKNNLDIAINEIQKKFGKCIAKASECKALTMHKISTGSLYADYILKGGLPRRRLIEIYAPEHVGKTFFAFKLIAANQKKCRFCGKDLKEDCCKTPEANRILYIDFEETFAVKKIIIGDEGEEEIQDGKVWAQQCGIDLDSLVIVVPSSWDKAIDLIQYVVKERKFDIIIVDSLTSAPVEYIMDRDTEDPTMGVKAARNSVFTSKLLQAFSPKDITNYEESLKAVVIILQQVREKISTGPTQLPPEPPGGWALKHTKHISIALSSPVRLGEDGNERKQGKKVCGRTVKGRIYKDKVEGQYLQEFFFDYYFQPAKITENYTIQSGSIDTVQEIMDIAILTGIIQRNGAWYSMEGVEGNIANGKDNLKQLILSNEQIREMIETKVKEVIYVDA